jgi:NAD+ kinase
MTVMSTVKCDTPEKQASCATPLRPMNPAFLITKAKDPRAWALGQKILAWLSSMGVHARLMENPEPGSSFEQACAAVLHDFGCDPGLILVLGGDGTMLSVARRLHPTSAPLLGVNLGKVGFLTEVSTADWRPCLERLLAEGVARCERMALAFRVIRPGVDAPITRGRVINDIVIARGALARLISLDVNVDNEHLGEFRADGLIVSTPTGATGYSVSADGPLLHPALRAFCLTAVCPFLHEFTPLVLPEEAKLSVTLPPGAADAFLTLDGQEGFPLQPGDRVDIHRSEQGFHMARLHDSSYFGKLKAKGFVRAHGERHEGEA